MSEVSPETVTRPPTYAAGGNTFDGAPEHVEPEAPAPISVDNVVSKPEETVAAPDSSILSDKIEKMLSREQSIDQRREQEEQYTAMQEELRVLRMLKGPDFQQQYNETSKKVEAADDDQSRLMKDLQAELHGMKERQDLLQTELKRREQDSELQEASREMVAWVKSNEEHFPLINLIDQQPLVLQKILNTRQQTGHTISETQAARDIEEELTDIVTRCAPLLGFQKSEQKSEREDTISTTTSGLNISEPVDRDNMTDVDHLQYLIRQHQG